MIDAGRRRAIEARQPIYVFPNPTTRSAALENLRAFSDEGRCACHEPEALLGREPFSSDAQVNGCLGWSELNGSDIPRTHRHWDIKVDETYFCIVYDFVPKDKLDVDTIVSQLDFFHLAGFHNVPFNPANWRAGGVLVDFSDLVSPFENKLRWDRELYALHQSICRPMISHFSDEGRLK